MALTTPTPPAPNAYAQSDSITLLFGPERESFKVHRNLLTAKSEYFCACLSGGLTEADNNTVILPEDAVAGIRVFVDWLYSGRLEITEEIAKNITAIYRFADRSCSEAYFNDFLDAARAYAFDNCISFTLELEKLYEQGLRHTPFAEFCLKTMVWSFLSINPDENMEQRLQTILGWWSVRPELLRDFALEACSFHWKPYSHPAGWSGCHFHTPPGRSCCGAGNKKA